MATFGYQAAGATEAQQRQALAYLLEQVSTGLARTGILSGLVVGQTATASGSVDIGSGACVVQSSVIAGAALLVSNTTATLDVLGAHPMGGLPRNDVVVFDSVTSDFAVIVGTPNAVPTDPTVPATACPLARLRHAASATTIPTAKIDDLRVETRLFGGRRAYEAFTATLGSSGTAPNLGTGGGDTGYFTEEGNHVSGQVVYYWGTSVDVGTGTYLVPLPRNAITRGASGLRVGTVTLVRAATGAEVHADLVAVNAGQAKMTYSAGADAAAVDAGAAAPWVPSSGDTYFVRFDYERA